MKGPLRILHVIDSGGLYGAESVLLDLCTGLRQLDQRPIIASIGTDSVEKPLERAARARSLETRSIRAAAGPNPRLALKLLQVAATERADIVHSHGYKGNILLGFMPRRWRSMPIVATIHGYTHVSWFDRVAWYRALDRVALRRFDRVVLVHRAMARALGLRETNTRWRVIENGLRVGGASSAPGSMDLELVKRCEGRFPIIGAIGRLSSEKGFDVLLRAAARVFERYERGLLIILGEGPERDRLEKLAVSFGLGDRVTLPGYRADARSYCRLFNVFALPSLTEGLPITLLEAMDAGVPIVATRVGGVPDVLEFANTKNGVLVDRGDVDALADAILRCVDHETFASDLARNAKAASARFSSERMAAQYFDLYQELIAGSRPR